MNQLLNPFIQDYPESLDTSIPYPAVSIAGLPVRCKFNPLTPLPRHVEPSLGLRKTQTLKRRRSRERSSSSGHDGVPRSGSQLQSGSGGQPQSRSRSRKSASTASFQFDSSTPAYAGSLLALGTSQGLIDILDMDTRSRIRRFGGGSGGGHVRAIESLSWSRNSRYLLSGSKDWKLCIWDLAFSGENMPDMLVVDDGSAGAIREGLKTTRRLQPPLSPLRESITLDAPVLNATFHPRTSKIILVNQGTGQVCLVFLCRKQELGSRKGRDGMEVGSKGEGKGKGKGKEREIVLLEDWMDGEKEAAEEAALAAAEEADVRSDQDEDDKAPPHDDSHPERPPVEADVDMDADVKSSKAPKRKAPDTIPLSRGRWDAAVPDRSKGLTCATFHPNGNRIYVGTNQGMLLIIDMGTRKVLSRHKVSTATLKQLSFSRLGSFLVLNSSDRALRVLSIDDSTSPPTILPLHRFQDQISKTPWNAIGFSGDGEYVVGGAGTKESHLIYIWDRPSGTLVKVLEGPKDALVDCDWSPTKPLIASITSAGSLNLFQTAPPASWSSFAPGFEELEENREYIEKESEFDLEDEEELERRKEREEDEEVDVWRLDGGENRPIQMPLEPPLEGQPRKGDETFAMDVEVHKDSDSDDLTDDDDDDDDDDNDNLPWELLYPDEDSWTAFFPHVDLEDADEEDDDDGDSDDGEGDESS